jgi:zinc transporter 1/2/3
VIGITLIVAGDSVFVPLTVVIIFHQMFEGLALGTRIADLGQGNLAPGGAAPHHGHHHNHQAAETNAISPTTSPAEAKVADSPVPMSRKLLLASAFALVTPIGMAIGLGALHRFNGNDPSTVVALGTLDALSAGILAWVGIVEMLAADWVMPCGEMVDAGALVTGLGFTGLVAGMALMSFLGKWA